MDRLDAAAVTRMATDYLARYAASTGRLRRVLERRISRWHAKRDLEQPHDAAAVLDEVIGKLVASGLVDDDAFAVGKARSLLRKGLPERRIRSTLRAAGLDPPPDALDAVLDRDEATQARRFVARKRLGPCRATDRASHRDKDIRSLMRAGFSYRAAVQAVDAEPEE